MSRSRDFFENVCALVGYLLINIHYHNGIYEDIDWIDHKTKV